MATTCTTYGGGWRVAFEALTDELVLLAVWNRRAGRPVEIHPALYGLPFAGEATARTYLDSVGFTADEPATAGART